jgi:hypothetical protein
VWNSHLCQDTACHVCLRYDSLVDYVREVALMSPHDAYESRQFMSSLCRAAWKKKAPAHFDQGRCLILTVKEALNS